MPKNSQGLKNLEKDRWKISNKEKQDKEANLGEQKGPGAKGNLRLEEGRMIPFILTSRKWGGSPF
jgi:hypothetical protein